MENIDAIRAYIAATPAAALPEEVVDAHDATIQEALALSAFAKTNPLEAIAIAIKYGRVLGLQMGREEAKKGANK